MVDEAGLHLSLLRSPPKAGPVGVQKRRQRTPKLRWARRAPASSGLHRRDLVLGAALAAGDDGAGMAHPPPPRRGAAGDEADHRLRTPLLRLVCRELRGLLLRRAGVLAEH